MHEPTSAVVNGTFVVAFSIFAPPDYLFPFASESLELIHKGFKLKRVNLLPDQRRLAGQAKVIFKDASVVLVYHSDRYSISPFQSLVEGGGPVLWIVVLGFVQLVDSL